MSFPVDALHAIRLAIADLEEEGFGTEDLREGSDALAELVKAGDRVTAAFRALGLDNSLINRSRLSKECEDSMVALDTALARVKGGDA
ncbi:hypothetical protein JY439_02720 [Stenotrophomonas maltophilia]|nr:hypothetical protein [Stenotrophomonas maltophilia]